MAVSTLIQKEIEDLKYKYDSLKSGKQALLDIIDEIELPESVYNSNAIENSTLTISETEKILLELEISRNVSIREVFEAQNLSKVIEFIKKNIKPEINEELILLLHKILIGNINDDIAGRFRKEGEYVRIGTYVALAPEYIKSSMRKILVDFSSNQSKGLIDKISEFHLKFEQIHPFIDGNGRIGRVLINYQLLQQGFPPIIIQQKEKKLYHTAFKEYDQDQDGYLMGKIISLAIKESFHKRITYLEHKEIIRLSKYAESVQITPQIVLNKAKRQTIPAFREKGIWKIGV